MPRKAFPPRRDGLYHLPGGKKYPSVTEITGTSVHKPFLVPWAAKMAAAAVLDDPDRYDTAEKAAGAVIGLRDAAADRGKALHALIEEWAKTGQLPEGDEGYARGFRTFVRAWSPKPLYTEVTIINHTHGYAGRLDLIAQLGNEVWLIDFKTGKYQAIEHGLQLVAYRNAETLTLQDDLTERPMPKVDHTGLVYIPGDGTFDFCTVEEPFEVFLAAKQVWAWSHSKQR